MLGNGLYGGLYGNGLYRNGLYNGLYGNGLYWNGLYGGIYGFGGNLRGYGKVKHVFIFIFNLEN